MNNFSYQDDLQRIIVNRKLIELDIQDDDERRTCYLFSLDEEYMVLARVTNDATLDGVTICLSRDLQAIQTETRFCQTLSQIIDAHSLYKEAQSYLEPVKNMSFQGFISAYQGTPTLISMRTTNGNGYTGRIVNFDDDILVIDEYYVEEGEKFSRTYLDPSLIRSITLGSSWLKVVSRSLAS